jgi:GNAT superfamily N-acetyltransferase
MDPTIELTDVPLETEIAAIEASLVDFNSGLIGRTDKRPLALFLRDDQGRMIGGLVAVTARGWLIIEMLFVPEILRGRGLAGRLLKMAEDEARARGCHGAWLDTVNADARRIYQKHGYATFGTLPDFPLGNSLSFMQKPL